MEKEIGVVDDFFAKVGVAALVLKDELSITDTIHIKGHTTDLTQVVGSMQIDHISVEKAKKKASVGIKVTGRVRKGDIVYKVLP